MERQNNNPIKRFGSKDTVAYQNFAQDFWAVRERQWLSIWLQAAPTILSSDIHSVLEFGGGRDLTRSIARHYGVKYFSVDISDDFFPDIQSSIIDYAFEGKTHDLVCSFQCLEHNPWQETQALITHMAKFTTNTYIFLSPTVVLGFPFPSRYGFQNLA